MHTVKRLVIAGGGTAGWIAAAALSHQFRGILEVTLVESEEIGTVGVGESTIPPIRAFHRLLRIDEQDFMRATAATFKLGIAFEGWRKPEDHYLHPFGMTGKSTWACEFHHFWLHSLARGMRSELGDFCLESQAAKAGKFALASDVEINYAYHLDAGVYAKFLRKFAEGHGAKRIEGKISRVEQHPETGYVSALVLNSGQRVEGDFFIDCTGFRGLLIEQALHTGYEDWTHWLPCDSAVPVQTESVGPPRPYTRAIAHEAGWRWQIPLQHRVGNGVVYCSRYMSDDEATAKLLREVEGRTLITPRPIKFRTGRRRMAWNRNVVALGLASGFVEPLESTSIHLIITGVARLIHLFPFDGVTPAFVEHYNNETRNEWEGVRDFIILHYRATERDDSPFWRYCRQMQVPDSLAHRIGMFRERGHAWQGERELFRVDSWIHVMLGQGITPEHYHGMTRALSDQDLKQLMEGLKTSIGRIVERMPAHQDFVTQYCRAANNVWG